MKIKFIFYAFALTIVNTLYAQIVKKDTLFFEYDKEYIRQSNYECGIYYIKDSSDDEWFMLEKESVTKDLILNKLLSFKMFVRNSEFYRINSSRPLLDYDLMKYLSKYEIYLVDEYDDTIDFIKVVPSVAIE